MIGVDLKRRREKMIRIVNIYNLRAREPPDRPARRLNWQKVIRQRGGSMELARDFNTLIQHWVPS